MSTPLFSIIIPAYNVIEYCGTTIESILKQTFADFEVLVIDDGSTDGSGKLLDEFSKQDKRLIVFHQQNSGVSAARNLGLDNAKGEWIIFVDGDDALCNDSLKILSEYIALYPDTDLIGYGFKKTDHIKISDLNQSRDVNDKIKVFDNHHTVSFEALNHHMVWTETFRRAIIGDLRFSPLKNGEDILFCHKLAVRANLYLSLDAQLYFYLQRPESARSNSWTYERAQDYISMHEGIFASIKSSNKLIDPKWTKRWIGTLLLFIPQIWQLEKTTRQVIFKKYFYFLKEVEKLPGLPNYLRIWIKNATAIRNIRYFWATAMVPMKTYSAIK